MAFVDNVESDQVGGGGTSSGGNTGSGGNRSKQATVSNETMSAVADVLDCLWTLLTWLNRPPFNK